MFFFLVSGSLGTNILPIQGGSPIPVWEALRSMPGISELAGFAILLLLIVVNQAGCERVFSDLKVKQTDR